MKIICYRSRWNPKILLEIFGTPRIELWIVHPQHLKILFVNREECSEHRWWVDGLVWIFSSPHLRCVRLFPWSKVYSLKNSGSILLGTNSPVKNQIPSEPSDRNVARISSVAILQRLHVDRIHHGDRSYIFVDSKSIQKRLQPAYSDFNMRIHEYQRRPCSIDAAHHASFHESNAGRRPNNPDFRQRLNMFFERFLKIF